MVKILLLETKQGLPESELPKDLEYSSCVAREIAPTLRSLGHEVIEIQSPSVADAINAINTHQPDVVWHAGHGQKCITTLENEDIWMTHKSSSYGECNEDRYLEYAPNRFFSMLSCLAGSELGPRLVASGATAFMGYKTSFWFVACDYEPCTCGSGLDDPDEIRAVKSPMQCDLEWLCALAEGKTVKEAYERSQAKFQSEIEYWENSTHPIAATVLQCLHSDKEAQVVLGDMDAKIGVSAPTPTPPLTGTPTGTPTPAPATPVPLSSVVECIFPRILAGMLTPRLDKGVIFYRVQCIINKWGNAFNYNPSGQGRTSD